MVSKNSRIGTWSLNELYDSFDGSSYQNDFKALINEIEKIKKWAKDNLSENCRETEKIEEYIILLNNLEKYEKLDNYAELTLSVDAENEKAAKYCDMLDEARSELSDPETLFKKFVYECDDLEGIIAESDILREHSFFLHETKQNGKYRLSEKEELIIAKLESTGSSAWSRMKDQLTSTMLVDINIDGEDKKLPLSIIRNMAEDPIQEVRKKAYEAEIRSYNQVEKAAAAALNGIKAEVITICGLRGYNSPLEMTIIDSRINTSILDTMFSAIKDYLPVFAKYFRKKAKILGHNAGLPFYDIFAPVGSANSRFSYEEAAEYIIKNFSRFSEKLGAYAKKAFDLNWIDAFPKKGKTGGAFCANLHSIKASRILSNFSGSYGDVRTLAHELGHGYHGECLNNETYINSDYPMPIAETASTFCETIITKAALETATKEEAIGILEQQICDTAQVIVDIYSRYLFEDEVFNRRSGGYLAADEFNDIMIKSQKKAYGGGLDENCMHSYMWICKSHYYDSHYNYYNFPYAFGLLFAKGLYSIYLNDKTKFLNNYDTLLAATGKNHLLDVGKLMGINFEDKSFWVSSLEIIKNEINEFCDMLK